MSLGLPFARFQSPSDGRLQPPSSRCEGQQVLDRLLPLGRRHQAVQLERRPQQPGLVVQVGRRVLPEVAPQPGQPLACALALRRSLRGRGRRRPRRTRPRSSRRAPAAPARSCSRPRSRPPVAAPTSGPGPAASGVQLAGRLGVVQGQRRGDRHDLRDALGVLEPPLALEVPGPLAALVPVGDAVLEEPPGPGSAAGAPGRRSSPGPSSTGIRCGS